MTASLPPTVAGQFLGLQPTNQISSSISNLDLINNPKVDIDSNSINTQTYHQQPQPQQQQQPQQTSPKQQSNLPGSINANTINISSNTNNTAQPVSNTSSASTILDQTTATINELISVDSINDIDVENVKSK